MKVLITGANGFIGSKLIDYACELYGSDNVIAMSSSNCSACKTFLYDSESFELLEDYSSDIQDIDVLIHAGAFIPKSSADANNILACNSNIKFTEKLLNLPFRNLRKIVFLSTVDIYKVEGVISESTRVEPSTLYGLSKVYCEKLIEIHCQNQKISNITLRIGHVYGPGEQQFSKFLPVAIKNIISSKPVELWGDGSELRTFIYVWDVAKAVVSAVDLNEDRLIINVVGSTALSIKNILDLLVEISGSYVEINKIEHNVHKRDLLFDNKLMKKYLLSHQTDLRVGLEKELRYFESLG